MWTYRLDFEEGRILEHLLGLIPVRDLTSGGRRLLLPLALEESDELLTAHVAGDGLCLY